MGTDFQSQLKEITLDGVAITAAIDADGGLHEVGGAFKKLLAAARERTFPRIHTVVVAADQRLNNRPLSEDRSLEKLQLQKDPVKPAWLKDPTMNFMAACFPRIRGGDMYQRENLPTFNGSARAVLDNL